MSSWFSWFKSSKSPDSFSDRPNPSESTASPPVIPSIPFTVPPFVSPTDPDKPLQTRSTPETDSQGKRNIYDLESYYPKTGHRFVDPPVTDPDDPSALPPPSPPSSSLSQAKSGPNFPKVPETAFERVFKAKNPSEPLPEALVKDPEQIKIDHQYMDAQAQVNCSDINSQLTECHMSWTKQYFTLECYELASRADRCMRLQKKLLPAMKFGEPDNTVAQDRLYARLADDEGRRQMAEEDEQTRKASQMSDAGNSS